MYTVYICILGHIEMYTVYLRIVDVSNNYDTVSHDKHLIPALLGKTPACLLTFAVQIYNCFRYVCSHESTVHVCSLSVFHAILHSSRLHSIRLYHFGIFWEVSV